MPPRFARKPLNTYHHGDFRDTLVQAALREADGRPGSHQHQGTGEGARRFAAGAVPAFCRPRGFAGGGHGGGLPAIQRNLREAIDKPSKRSKLSRLAQATLDFGLRRNGIYRLMFASRIMACAAEGSELQNAAMETFALLLEALEAPAVGFLRERHALKIWAALHGVVMLAEQGLLTGQIAQISREELVEDIVEQTKLALSVAIKAAERGRP